MTASIVGWAHTPFGKFDAETVEGLVTRVANEAMADAGISAAEVDEIVLGHFNAGFSPQDFTASLVLQADPHLRFKPATRVENACATGSAAVHQGIRAIASGAAKTVLVVGVEQMTRTPAAEIGKNLLNASYLPEDGDTVGGFAGVFGKIAQGYFQKYGDQSDALAMIAAKNHKNGVANPYAQMRIGLQHQRSREILRREAGVEMAEHDLVDISGRNAGVRHRLVGDLGDKAFHGLGVKLSEGRMRPSDDAGCHGVLPEISLACVLADWRCDFTRLSPT